MPAPTRTNNEFFSGTNAGLKTFSYALRHLYVHISGTVGISFDNVNFMTLTAGNHYLHDMCAKQVFFNGSGTWTGWGIAG